MITQPYILTKPPLSYGTTKANRFKKKPQCGHPATENFTLSTKTKEILHIQAINSLKKI